MSWNSIEVVFVKALVYHEAQDIDFIFDGVIVTEIEAGLHKRLFDEVYCNLEASSGAEMCVGNFVQQIEQEIQCYFELDSCQDSLKR